MGLHQILAILITHRIGIFGITCHPDKWYDNSRGPQMQSPAEIMILGLSPRFHSLKFPILSSRIYFENFNLQHLVALSNLLDNIKTFSYDTKDCMLAIEVLTVVLIQDDEELGSAGVGLSRVGHGERTRLVGELGVRWKLILDSTVGRSAGAGLRAHGIPAVGAPELAHEAVDDPVKMQAVVKAILGEGDEVRRRDGHFVQVDLHLESAQ